MKKIKKKKTPKRKENGGTNKKDLNNELSSESDLSDKNQEDHTINTEKYTLKSKKNFFNH